jgi:hypothetical protein
MAGGPILILISLSWQVAKEFPEIPSTIARLDSSNQSPLNLCPQAPWPDVDKL